ncbi:Hydrophobic surface binding protein [Mycena indigotica]|uniref:Hydrophobic surface binding protein n=1 Tax=Mycena indigotica TaxID=2126181 RepID=A0A8H6RZL4_9AGAR|nr:Hydrophobic surface binding protein [Mycena indigotica]KAF7289762.1 Hydrophobic surface binding protein [Mycena indigotica]
MMVFPRLFTVLSVAALSVALVAKRDVAAVVADIATITTQVTNLDNAIQAFPVSGGSLAAALGIHNSATALVTSLNTGTTDAVAAGPFTEEEGTAILASVEAIEPTILSALEGIVAKKPGFQSLPIGGLPALILQDLRNLQTATTAFADALIADSPEDLVERATAIRDGITAAFVPAIAAYSS